MQAAGVGSNVLGVGAGVLAAVQGAYWINPAYGLALVIIGQPGALIGQLTAGTATNTPAPAGLTNGQKGRESPPDFSGPGILSRRFYFSNSHLQGIRIAIRPGYAINSRP